MATFTEQVNKKLAEINETQLVSENNVVLVAQYISELAGYQGRILQEVAHRRAQYNLCLNERLTGGEHKSVAHAKIDADSSPEYAELEKARALKEAVAEKIRGLKYLFRSMQDDYKYP